jgi:hypothetical protein
MKLEHAIKAIIYLTVIVWATVLQLNGEAMPSMRPLSTVTAIVIIVAVLFDLWLWKLSLLKGWLVRRPVISGTWKVELRSNWKDPTGGAIPPTEGYMVIHQSLSKLSLRLLTNESSSELIGSEIICSIDGIYFISGVYRNEPRYELRDKSTIHFGAIWLQVVNEHPGKMHGHYWTDRNTAGEIELFNCQRKRFQTFQAAKDHFDHLQYT